MTAFKFKNRDRENVRDVSELVVRDFCLEEKRESIVTNDLQEFRGNLCKVINHMLDHDFERLLNAMYRLDINEDRFKKILTGQKIENVAQNIADLVINRELQKLITRRKHNDGNL